jgi:hypothetical protein
MSLKNSLIASYSLRFPSNSEKFYLIFLSRPTHAKLSNGVFELTPLYYKNHKEKEQGGLLVVEWGYATS